MANSQKPESLPYLTPTQVAEKFKVSPITVRQWSSSGKLKCVTTPGGHRRYSPEDIAEFAKTAGISLEALSTGPCRIMIIEDDSQLAHLLQEFISSYDDSFEVYLAEDGFRAGEMLHTLKPDLILLDLMMPGMNGFEVCERIKRNPATRNIKVVAMTGFSSEHNVTRILNAGAETCLKKPIDFALLRDILALCNSNNPA